MRVVLFSLTLATLLVASLAYVPAQRPYYPQPDMADGQAERAYYPGPDMTRIQNEQPY